MSLSPPPRDVIYRHSRLVRVTHWINALAIILLLMSGLNIFNAHPALYVGRQSHFDRPILSIEGFPGWLTLPAYNDLATARHWHFFFAWVLVLNGLAYLWHGVSSRHVQKDLWTPLRDFRTIPAEIWHHIQLKFPEGEAARSYNVLQRLSYFGVALVLGPLIVLTGLSMSPGVNAAMGNLLPEIFGGRQTARTLHFICAALFAAFIVVHLAMVLVSGVGNNLRSMITGRYRLPPPKAPPETRP